jgi:hypothetical protein
MGGQTRSLVEVAKPVPRARDGVDDDEGTLAALEAVDGVHEPRVVLAEPMLQAGLDRLDLFPVRGDHAIQSVGRCPPEDSSTYGGEHGVVLQTADELVDHSLMHRIRLVPAAYRPPTFGRRRGAVSMRTNGLSISGDADNLAMSSRPDQQGYVEIGDRVNHRRRSSRAGGVILTQLCVLRLHPQVGDGDHPHLASGVREASALSQGLRDRDSRTSTFLPLKGVLPRLAGEEVLTGLTGSADPAAVVQRDLFGARRPVATQDRSDLGK